MTDSDQEGKNMSVLIFKWSDIVIFCLYFDADFMTVI